MTRQITISNAQSILSTRQSSENNGLDATALRPNQEAIKTHLLGLPSISLSILALILILILALGFTLALHIRLPRLKNFVAYSK